MLDIIIANLKAEHLFWLVETALVGVIAIVIYAIYSGLAKTIADKFIKDKNNE